MAVRVTHYSTDEIKTTTTDHDSSSWQIDDNSNLTIGDSLGNPEAAYADRHWLSVAKLVDEEDEDLLD